MMAAVKPRYRQRRRVRREMNGAVMKLYVIAADNGEDGISLRGRRKYERHER